MQHPHQRDQRKTAHSAGRALVSRIELAPLATGLYRYFFYDWLFRDVGRGNRWERSAAWLHNRDQSRCLPTYMRRWVVTGVLLWSAASFFKVVLSTPTLSAFFYMASVLVVPFTAVTAVCWLFLHFNRHPG